MKIIITLLCLGLFSCVVESGKVKGPEVLEPRGRGLPSASIGAFRLQLLNIDGRCVVNSLPKVGGVDQATELRMDIGAPCEFIRDQTTHEPMFHTYQSGPRRHNVLIVTGGPSNPKEVDMFMPSGCGTRLQKIFVFDDRVEIGPPPQQDVGVESNTRCPSSGLDEVYFAV